MRVELTDAVSDPSGSDFFVTRSGGATAMKSWPRAVWRGLDYLYDRKLDASSEMRRLRLEASAAPRRKILTVGIEVPTRPRAIHDVLGKLHQASRHDISTSVVLMGDKGKFRNIDDAIAQAPPLAAFDWLVIVDDDIGFAEGFLDDLILLSEATGLSLIQPAHAFESHASYGITRRRWGSLARQTNFVEIGPLTLVRADVFTHLIPFPESRWCYGIDLVWSEVLRRLGRTMGVIDGAPMRHLRPIAGSYDYAAALTEAQALIRRFDVRQNRDYYLRGDKVLIETGF